MRMGIITFLVDGVEYRFKEPLMLENEIVEGKLYLSHKELSLFACGKSWLECDGQIRDELADIWRDYALAPDKMLTKDAVALKKRLWDMVVRG